MTAILRPPSFTGSLKELIFLFSPVLLITFSTSLSFFVEKLLFARLSAETLETAVSVSISSQIFRFPCIALTMLAQVWVGRWFGANEWKAIGSGIWQFLWFSFLSIFITLPLSIIYANYYFKDIPYSGMMMPYYYFLIFINFLYPLATTLTCFYLGQGKTSLILWSTLAFQVIKLILSYLLILGWGWIPSLGLIGGAISTLIAQGSFCLLLLAIFLHPKNAKIYNTRSWHFQPKLFWVCIYPGFLRAIGSILIFACWASIGRLMIAKGGDYNLVFSVGNTLGTFLFFLGEAMVKAQTTVVSQFLGARNYLLMNKAFRSGVLLVTIITAILSIPLVIFPSMTFHYLFPKIDLDETMISQMFLGVWTCSSLYTLCYVPISYVLAYKDTKFMVFMGVLNWIDGYLLIYIFMEYMHIPASQFWLVVTLTYISIVTLYYFRVRWLQSKTPTELSQASIGS